MIPLETSQHAQMRIDRLGCAMRLLHDVKQRSSIL